MGVVSHCQQWRRDLCFHLTIRSQLVYLGFLDDDLSSTTKLDANRWYHLAAVYNNQSNQQLIYLDGILDSNRTASGPYLGIPSPVDIGRVLYDDNRHFDGLIDQVSMLNRVMSDSEILEQATLAVYYSFNRSIEDDSGPNQINASAVNVTLAIGIASGSLLFNQTDAYFQIRNLVLLADSNRSYSFSFWIYPLIDHADLTLINAISSGSWCSAFVGFDSYRQLGVPISDGTGLQMTGSRLATDTWNHIALVYAKPSTLTLYINGSMSNRTNAYRFENGPGPVTLTIGQGNDYTCSRNSSAQFWGKIDEFRVYARSLSPSEIGQLAIPWMGVEFVKQQTPKTFSFLSTISICFIQQNKEKQPNN